MKEKEIDNNMETKEKAKTILDWDYINKEFEGAIIQEDCGRNLLKKVCIIDYKMFPSGKHGTPTTNDNLTEEEFELDNDFIDKIIEEVNENIIPNNYDYQYVDFCGNSDSMILIRRIKTKYEQVNNYVTLNPRNFLTDTI